MRLKVDSKYYGAYFCFGEASWDILPTIISCG